MSSILRNIEFTEVCGASRDTIHVRGKDLCRDLIGHISISGFLYLHVTGREANPAQCDMLDALIVAMAEHGLVPSALAARMTYSAAPDALQGAIAAGILGAGSVVLGASGQAAELLAQGVELVHNGRGRDEVAALLVTDIRNAGHKLPGFGHTLHKPDDPRAVRLLALARELGVSGDHCALLDAIAKAADQAWGKHLVLNIQGAIAAIACDLGLPPLLVRAIPIVARTIGLLGHIAEEMEQPIGFQVSFLAAQHIPYRHPRAEDSGQQ